MNSVPCLTWVRRGVAKRNPERVKLTSEELEEVIKLHEGKLKSLDINSSDSESEQDEIIASGGSRKRKLKPDVQDDVDESDDITKKYGLDDYDDDVDDEDDASNAFSLAGVSMMAGKKDPYLDDGESDEDDVELLPGDNMIVVGKVRGDFCNLEVYVYNQQDGNLFCHHDILLPSFPLTLEWLDYDPEEKNPGNLVAMGTMEPDIEIWDLDVIDAVQPAYILAGADKRKSKKKKKSSVAGHSDAVLDLAWNPLQRQVLASASADFTVGLWDLEKCQLVSSLKHHKEKVQAVAWHPQEAESLLSGSFDQTVKVYDCRNPDTNLRSWTLPGEVEHIIWNHNDPFYFLAGTDTGHVYYMDVRADKPVMHEKVHSGAVTGLSLSSSVPGCLVTTSDDKLMKVWDIRGEELDEVFQKNLHLDEIHCCSSSPDSNLTFAVGGEVELRIINLARNKVVTSHFGLESKDGEEDLVADLGADTDEEEAKLETPPEEKLTKKKKKNKKKKKTT